MRCKNCTFEIGKQKPKVKTVYEVCPKCNAWLPEKVIVEGTENNFLTITITKLLG